MRPDYLLVDGHSIIFAWPELKLLHDRRTALAREALIKQLRDYQDWSGTRVVVGSLELRGPSPFLSDFTRLAAFVDVGQVWAAGVEEIDNRVDLAGGNLVVTPGFGLRISTPVGPIRADLGYNAYDLREGPLYLATGGGGDGPSDLVMLLPRFAPEQETLLDRVQLHIAVGQAF